MWAARQAAVGAPLAGVSSVPCSRAAEAAGARSYRARQSDGRAGIEETWLGDKAETASRPATVLAR
jgi:hypothetical protein